MTNEQRIELERLCRIYFRTDIKGPVSYQEMSALDKTYFEIIYLLAIKDKP